MFQKYLNSLISNWKEILYFLVLGTFIVALSTSIALITISVIAMLVLWVLTGDYKEKWNRLIHNTGALLMMSIPLLYLIGLCFTHNLSLGFHELNKSSYWFIFAFVLGSLPPISYKAASRLLGIYIITVTIAAGAALLKFVSSNAIHYFDFREVTWIHHIPFSFQIAFAIWIIFYFIYYKNFSWIQKILLLFLIAFLTLTLFSLKSFSGYLYFGVMSITALLMLMWKTKKKWLKFALMGSVIFITILPVFYVYHCVQKFYNVIEYKPNEIEQYTANGNKYKHNFNNKTKENGNYVGLFLCEKELIPLWDAHSCKPYQSNTMNGHPFRSVIVRYMTSKGLTKDAEGFAQLSQKDIENIENELPNYIYAENKLSIYPRIYETIWEMDQYIHNQYPNEKTLSQRIELSRLAVVIIKKQFWLGIGLGNNAFAYEDAIVETGSKLVFMNLNSSHNQYLNYLMRFGIFGTLYILGVLFWVFIKGRKNNPFLITIFFVSILAANFAEINWETFLGLNFFGFFMCFFMWAVPKNFLNEQQVFENNS